jgi:hypothetical protein
VPHPYVALEGTPLWRVVDAALGELEANHDLEVTTARAYVVGYLCQRLATAGLASAGSDDRPSSR